MALEKRIKNDVDTDKKPKVYFTCHPDDFEMCFDKICEDIFKTHDCVILYKEDMSVAVPEEKIEVDLKRNNLFVIPVTEKLLTTDNCTMSQELPYAIREDIPVLPILMEEVSDEHYSSEENFGDLQYLNAAAKDDTSIAYEEKLKKYLDSVLISRELAERIRAAFDAYIFLSYRKKDRIYANNLMRLIHSNPECRDIAIWFDEFLTPGESFKDNIEKILDDCELFTLLVTPHLLEKVIDNNGEIKDNFVIANELPKARENKEKKGTDILAVEMVDTDRDALHGIHIDDCVNVRDEAAFRERLLESISKIALTENDNEPEHNFLIGLAYLEGIDVEVDRRRAAELVECAAEDGLAEAMARLIIMYSNGVGVTRSKDKVKFWSRRLADNYFEQIFSENGSIKSEEKIIELAGYYDNAIFEEVFRSLLLRADGEFSSDILKTFFDAFLTEGITEYTLLFEVLEGMQNHKREVKALLTKDILLKSANGAYPPYGPLFWYVPEYGLYEEVVAALMNIKSDEAFTNALALTRDVCHIFGHFNEITEITKDIGGKALLPKAQLSGVRKGLCELFFTGSTDCTDGLDIYPRCFNVNEAKSWKETGCGAFGRMPVPFEDELGLYSHEVFTELHGEYIGIVSVPYDREIIESKLNSKSCRKLCGLFLSPTENKKEEELAINSRHIKEIYIPENSESEYYYYRNKLSKNIAFLDGGIIYFRDKVVLPDCVTRVNVGAFANFSLLKSVILSDEVKEIGDGAFYRCRSLTSIDLPEGITKIGWKAFEGCSSLTSIDLPEGITEIGGGAFKGCSSLKSIKLPDGIMKIGWSAFSGCSSLTSINLSEGITEIGDSVFSGCSSLTSIDLPEGIKEIGGGAFSGCRSLISIKLPEGITEIGGGAFSGCSSLTAIKFPDSVIYIRGGIFKDCPKIRRIENCPIGYNREDLGLSHDCNISYRDDFQALIPDGTAEIVNRQFMGRKDIRQITIPDSVKRIGERAFEGCSSLTSINLPEGITEIGEGAFEGCCSLTLIKLPDGITKIGECAFSGCSSLTSIKLPEGITKIGWGAFEGCSSLTSINLSEGITEIVSHAFHGCSSLPSINLPDGIMKIGRSAFKGCSSLTSIDLPEGITEIGHSAFSGCSSLTAIKFPDSMIYIRGGIFKDCPKIRRIENCPIGYSREDLGLSHDCNISYRDDFQTLVIPDGITEIADEQFMGRKDIRQITIPDSVKRIGERAFEECSSLTSISLPDGITKIGEDAFEGCSLLTSIDLPKGLTKISALAFSGCSSLTSINLHAGIMEIDRNAFSGCSSLTSINLPEGITKIGEGAFRGCSSLISIKLPEGITEIGWNAFEGCSSLKSINLPEGITEIGGGAFNGCSSLTSIDLPTGITEIGWNTFSDCRSLTSIKLPEGITEIGWSAFERCSSLKSINLPKGITEIGMVAFSCCSSLTSIDLPERITEIGMGAFEGCSLLESINLPEGIAEIDMYTFCDCYSLAEITIPASVRIIGADAFKGCKGLQEITIPIRFEDDIAKIFSDVDLSELTINWI